MGRVLTEVKIENLADILASREGTLTPGEVRSVVVSDALVDTGATTLGLPTRYIRQLGLKKNYQKRSLSSTGQVTVVDVYDPVRLTIQERVCPIDAMEVPDNVPVLIGHIPLETMDLVVDPRGKRLIGNPAHGGEHILEML